MMVDKAKPKIISDRFIKSLCLRLTENKVVRRSIPGGGRVHIDRQLPFLCIYRKKTEGDCSYTEKLLMGEASYIVTIDDRKQNKQLSLLVKEIINTLRNSFGSFLLVEIWSSPEDEREFELPPYQPIFNIFRPKRTLINSTIEKLEKTLKTIKIRKEQTCVNIIDAAKITSPNLPQLLSVAEAKKLGCHLIGVGIRPIYVNKSSDLEYPLIRRALHRGFSRALKNSFFEFTHEHTTHRPKNYQALGARSVVKSVWEVDRQLAEISNDFDFLLHVSPTNSKSAWSVFQRNKYQTTPNFIYRPLPIDPMVAKRKLFDIPIEKIEDPTLSQLFRQQQLELDRKFTMLIDRGTSRFLYGSLQLYGSVDESLMTLSKDLLDKLPPRSRDDSIKRFVDAETFAQRARDELEYFQKYFPDGKREVRICDDINGLMVSQGNLLIDKKIKIPASRVEALIQHEIGTHVLTHINGNAQPLKQLYLGLANYDELQEGLAVLSEYMVDGLSRPRLRLLAARVVAVKHMIEGATFIEVFRELNKVLGFERRSAFNITIRTFRGGGLTKDAIYLKGLVKLLKHLKDGGSLESLLIGKISIDHVAIMNELLSRKVLSPIPLRPRYLDNPNTLKKIKDLQNGLNPINLITRSKL